VPDTSSRASYKHHTNRCL